MSDSETSESDNDLYYRQGYVKRSGTTFTSSNPRLYGFSKTNRSLAKKMGNPSYDNSNNDFFEKLEYKRNHKDYYLNTDYKKKFYGDSSDDEGDEDEDEDGDVSSREESYYDSDIYDDKILGEDLIDGDNEKYEVEYVYHLSNIGIKDDVCYKERFQMLFKKIKERKKRNGVIVITGGLHDEDSESFYNSAVYLLTGLCKLMPTILLLESEYYEDYSNKYLERGDFDEDEDYCNIIDKIIDKMVTNINFYHVSGAALFDFYNITFSVSGPDGKVIQEEDMDYQLIKLRKYLIGLHHDDIHGEIRTNDFPVDPHLFYNYDYVLLGGNDRFQFVRKNMWYSGSLLQHDKDEVMNIHGFVELDLENDAVKFIELKA